MSTDLRTAAQQSLEALESLQGGCTDHDDGTVEALTVWCPEVIDALRAALAQPQSCVGNDPLCPCQDGDVCNYRDSGETKAWPVPEHTQKGKT